jgi:hypothetical protein
MPYGYRIIVSVKAPTHCGSMRRTAREPLAPYCMRDQVLSMEQEQYIRDLDAGWRIDRAAGWRWRCVQASAGSPDEKCRVAGPGFGK